MNIAIINNKLPCRTKENHQLKAFTLVELMVAIAVLVILVAAILKLVSGVSEKAKVTKTQSEIKVLSDAAEAFKQSSGYYPMSVPYDAWVNSSVWQNFANTIEWNGNNGQPDYKSYFEPDLAEGDYRPEFAWSDTPTNIHMLTFQMIQVSQSNSVIEQLKQNHKVDKQKSFSPSPEKWIEQDTVCKLMHPLDGRWHPVYQPQDAWGTPLRYWSGKIGDWAKARNWNSNIQALLSDKLQENNWGFFIESAGPDKHFGWWGEQGAWTSSSEQQIQDNIY